MAAFKAFLLTIVALLALAGTGARASNTVYAPGQGAANQLDVGIDVKASVRDRCGFAASGAPAASISQANFDQTGFSRDVPIILNCSGASRVAVRSANGGLVTGATATGYASKAPYDVTLNLVGDNLAKATATCSAGSLAAGGSCAAFAGTASSANGLRLASASIKANGSYVRLSAPAYPAASAPLIAGTYTDTLIVTVSAAP